MLAVGDQPELVEARLLEGRLWCPSCADGVLGPRGFASEHELRCPDGRRRLRFRRARCRACKATHVLVPTSTLLRRLDMVEVIGAALLAKVAGLGHRRIAGALGLAATTVRGCFAASAAGQPSYGRWPPCWRIDTTPNLGPIGARGSPSADAVEALGVAAAAVVRRFGPVRSPWQVISALTGTLMLPPLRLPQA